MDYEFFVVSKITEAQTTDISNELYKALRKEKIMFYQPKEDGLETKENNLHISSTGFAITQVFFVPKNKQVKAFIF